MAKFLICEGLVDFFGSALDDDSRFFSRSDLNTLAANKLINFQLSSTFTSLWQHQMVHSGFQTRPWSGWPDAFVKMSPKMSPKLFFDKIIK
jgi:hypothetical protein